MRSFAGGAVEVIAMDASPTSRRQDAELEIALNPSHPRNILPPPLPASHQVLDIGCGAGQTLIAAYPDRISFGLDIDAESLRLGTSRTRQVRFVQGRAEALPYRDESFDFVVARVSLPYTNLYKSLPEIHRVLRRGGQLWATLHPLGIPWYQAKGSNHWGKLFFLYVVANGLLLHCGLRQFSVRGRFESFQTRTGMRRALETSGFTEIAVGFESPQHLLATARREV